ncbi:MAG: IclR family transcriptional regulator [Chloroflexota bacterium]
MGRTNRPAKRTLQSVDKALGLLWAFDGSRAELGVVELARKAGLSPSNVSRLLSSLVQGDVVEYNEATGRYRLGMGLVRLASLVTDRLDLRTLSRAHLAALVESTQETASLNIFTGDQAVTIDFVPSPRAVVSLVHLGRRGLVHCTSVGKLLLACQRPDVWDRALSRPMLRFTPRTIVDPEILRADLCGIREQGYALAEEEREPELNAIAVPVHGLHGEVVAAIGLQGPAHRFNRGAMLHALPALRSEAEKLSRELGARPEA